MQIKRMHRCVRLEISSTCYWPIESLAADCKDKDVQNKGGTSYNSASYKSFHLYLILHMQQQIQSKILLPPFSQVLPFQTGSAQYGRVKTYMLPKNKKVENHYICHAKPIAALTFNKMTNLRFILPWARYVLRLCFWAWLTWMWDMYSESISKPFTWSKI